MIYFFDIMKSRYIFPIIMTAAFNFPSTVFAGSTDIDFNRFFNDSTLRIDYIFGGDDSQSSVLLQKMRKFDGWAGRRHRLSVPPYAGNGQVIVTDALSGDTIYANSFSTLYSEWLRTDEAKELKKSFQNSFLIPLPKEDAVITTSLFDTRHNLIATSSHRYSLSDILVDKSAPVSLSYQYIHKGGTPSEAIDVAILAEGYTESEMELFYDHAGKAVQAILSHSPFKERAGDFNFVAVASPSVDSGVTVPKENLWKDTAFGSHYSTFYADRYLTTPEVFNVHEALAAVPYEHIIILANSPEYGGGGIFNSYTLTTTGHKNFAPVVVHEFGHSFGGLADEYFYESDVMSDTYPLDVEPWEPNITTLVDFPSKWAHLLSKSTPVPTPKNKMEEFPLGVYEGAAYSFKGIFRGTDDCRMRTNDCPDFCVVCSDAISRLIDFYTKPQSKKP